MCDGGTGTARSSGSSHLCKGRAGATSNTEPCSQLLFPGHRYSHCVTSHDKMLLKQALGVQKHCWAVQNEISTCFGANFHLYFLKSGQVEFLDIVAELEGRSRWLPSSQPLSSPSCPQVRATTALTAESAWHWELFAIHTPASPSHLSGFHQKQSPCSLGMPIPACLPQPSHSPAIRLGTLLLCTPTCLCGDGTQSPGYPPRPCPAAAGTQSWWQ